uniref:Serine/threonine protein kinase n=2 Tax=Rhizophora mucronata TaxID=61149 RepID=A0A2P2L7U6_RHIMU
MISIEPAPMLEDKEKWSLLFHDFVARCLTKDPRLRPAASEMLKHKFIEKCKVGASAMLPKIEEAKHIRASMALQAQNPTVGPKLNQDYGDTVPSRKIQVESEESSSSVGMQLVAEGDFGTVIVHGGEETDLTALQSKPCDARQCSQDLVHVEGSSVSGTAGKSARSRVDGSRGVPADDTLVGESDSLVQTLPAPLPSDISTPEQNLKKNNSSQVPVEGSGGILGSTLKNENVKKAFALQDKVMFFPSCYLPNNR